jgi:hypothetical protein
MTSVPVWSDSAEVNPSARAKIAQKTYTQYPKNIEFGHSACPRARTHAGIALVN